jgi:hypothetical protein
MVGVLLMGAVFAAMSASVAPTAALVAGFQSTFQLAVLIIAVAAIATAVSICKPATS